MESLIEFGSNASAVTTVNDKTKCTTVRLLTSKEFKSARGLKGNAASVAYNDYLRTEGAKNPDRLVKKLASGELIVRSVKDYKGSVTLGLLKRDMIKDPVAKSPAKGTAPEIAERDTKISAFAALLKKLGATEADLAAAVAGADAGRLDPVPAAA